MSGLTQIHKAARQWRQELGVGLDTLCSADDLLALCEQATAYPREALAPGSPLLAGAKALVDHQAEAIYEDGSLSLPERRFNAAHEYAHIRLHGGTRADEDHDLTDFADSDRGARQTVEGYSPQQRREQEANAFAAELLLPTPLARRLFHEGKSASRIAALIGIPRTAARAQTAHALLTPDGGPDQDAPSPAPSAAPAPLDPSQEEAARWDGGALLLGAGPGTGKTKTLVGRCLALVQERNVPPGRILALTFNTKAAEELRERLAGAGVSGPWIGTFHAFGLEILRRFGGEAGQPSEIVLLDSLDQYTLLETHLARLGLDLLDDLYNPGQYLKAILAQISRAQDELCPPERYAQICRDWLRQAEADLADYEATAKKQLKKDLDKLHQQIEYAQKSLEVAKAYAVYEELKREGGYLDFGDLVARAVRLLEDSPSVRQQLQTEYRHVLADEYQDVNRACARLVKLVAGDRVWAVGDHRQSIYVFRGASPANIAEFQREYPGGERRELAYNYRSQPLIIDCFGAAARAMLRPEEQDGFQRWQARRDPIPSTFPSVTFAEAPDEDAQADGIAAAMETLRAEGRRWQEMAVLCRAHAQAGDLAERLTERGVPALYLGSLLQRSEIKDLLCLLSLSSGGPAEGVLRAARLPEYGVPAETAFTFVQGRDPETPLPEALRAEAHPGLQRLGQHLTALAEDANPSDRLRRYLFDLSDYLRHLEAEEPIPFRRTLRRLAIRRLLELASGYAARQAIPSAGGEAKPPTEAFLHHLRRLAASGEILRGGAEDGEIDAVRILTAHSAKGLEYPVVFVPNLSAGQFPSSGRGTGLRPPPGLTPAPAADDEDGSVTDEEACLFFVALSRARDHLILSRTETKAGKPAKPSPLLDLLAAWRAANPQAVAIWPGRPEAPAAPTAEAPSPLPDERPSFSEGELRAYLRCPRQYYYQRVLNLTGAPPLGGYPRFIGCVRATLQWIQGEQIAGNRPDGEAAETRLQAYWSQDGPTGHVHERRYWERAQGMVRRAAANPHPFRPPRPLIAEMETCRIRVRPDACREAVGDETLTLVRHLTDRIKDKDAKDDRLDLWRRAAADTHPGKTAAIELYSLTTGERLMPDVPKRRSDRLEQFERAAQAIRLGQFPPDPSRENECGGCGYAWICPVDGIAPGER